METPKKINWQNLKEFTKEADLSSTPVINRSRLVKVAGGLYRIRDNYESIWKMEAGPDGKNYIICADGDGLGEDSAQRFRIAEDDAEETQQKAAFKVLKLGKVYVAWECDDCKTPNLTKEGEAYECGQCHKKYADVFGKESQTTYTRDEVQEKYGSKFVEKMKKAGINKIHVSLLDLWLGK